MAVMNDTAINTRIQILCENKFSFLRNKFPGVLLLSYMEIAWQAFLFFVFLKKKLPNSFSE